MTDEPTRPAKTPQEPNALQAFLHERGARACLLRLGRPTRTVSEAAEALGVPFRCIVKSLLFCSPEGRCVIAVIRGDQRVDPVLLAAATGQRSLALAPAEQVETVTGYPAGATPPVGHRHQVPVIVDPAVLEEREVYGGGGTRDTMLRIEPAELVRLASAMVAPIARPA